MNPPLIINDVEIVSIHPVQKRFSLVVHINALPMQMYTPEIQKVVTRRVQIAVKYIVDEGFIPDPKKDNWEVTISGMCHPPK